MVPPAARGPLDDPRGPRDPVDIPGTPGDGDDPDTTDLLVAGHPLALNARAYFTLKYSLLGYLASLVLFFQTVAGEIFDFLFDTPGAWIFLALGLVLWVPVVVVVVFGLATVYCRRFRFSIAPEWVRITHGIVTTRHTRIHVARIQDLNVAQGLIQRLFGLYTLQIQTAGGSHARQRKRPEGNIMGITDAHALSDLLQDLRKGTYPPAEWTREQGWVGTGAAAAPSPGEEAMGGFRRGAGGEFRGKVGKAMESRDAGRPSLTELLEDIRRQVEALNATFRDA